MPFDLENANPPARFYWPGDSENEEWVDFRIASDADLVGFRKQCVQETVEYKQFRKNGPYQRFVNEVVDFDKLRDLTNVFCIHGWSLRTPDGTPIPCTEENKKKLMFCSPAFSTWAAQCLEKLRGDMEAKEAAAEKN